MTRPTVGDYRQAARALDDATLAEDLAAAESNVRDAHATLVDRLRVLGSVAAETSRRVASVQPGPWTYLPTKRYDLAAAELDLARERADDEVARHAALSGERSTRASLRDDDGPDG